MTISSLTLLFGLLAFAILAYLLRNEKDTDAVLRGLGTVLIVFAALFLVVAGYSDSQIAPAFGLLGTIAGYLFGKSSTNRPADGSSGGTLPGRTQAGKAEGHDAPSAQA
jgi:hypothetical protein